MSWWVKLKLSELMGTAQGAGFAASSARRRSSSLPRGDDFRTRMTHTLEVTGISRAVARALRLNEDPDRGHRARPRPRPSAVRPHRTRRRSTACWAHGSEFHHNEHSVRVVEVLERDGRGLNLTAEVRDGILHHTGSGRPSTLEGEIVRLVDRFGYVNHDIDDAVRAGSSTPATSRPGRSGSSAPARLPGSTPSCTTSSRRANGRVPSSSRPSTRRRSRSSAGSCSSTSTSARRHGPRARGRPPWSRIFSGTTWRAPTPCRPPTGWRGMTDRYALRAHAALASAA